MMYNITHISDSTANQTPIQTAWDKNRDLDDLRYSIQDEFDKINSACDLTNKKKSCDERRRDFDRNMGGQLKDIKRRAGSASVDLSSLEKYLADFGACVNNLCTDTGMAQETFWDDHRTCEYFRDDFNSTINDLNETVNNAECVANAKKWLTDTDRDFERNIKKQYNDLIKQANGELADLTAKFQVLQNLLPELHAFVDAGFQDCQDWNDKQRDFDDARNEWWDAHREIQDTVNLKQQSRDILRSIKDQRRSEKDMLRELKNIARQSGEEPAELKEYIACVADNLTQAEQVAESDPQTGWDYLRIAGDCSSNFWNTQNTYREKANVIEQCSDNLARESKDWERELKRIKRESIRDGGNEKEVSALQERIDDFNALRDEYCALAQTGEEVDFDAMKDLQFEIDASRQDWWDAMQNFHENREFRFFKERIDELERAVERAAEKLEEARDSKRYPGERITFCGKIVTKGQGLVGALKEAYAATDRGQVEDVMQEIEFLKGQAGPQCGFIFDEFQGPDVGQIVRDNLEGIETQIIEEVMQRVSDELVNTVMSQLLTMQENLIEEMMSKVEESIQEHIANVFEATTALKEENQQAIFEAKNEALTLGGQLRAIAERTNNKQLYGVADRVEQAVVVSNSAENLRNAVNGFFALADGLTGEDFIAEVVELDEATNQIVAEGQEELHDGGYVPYRDVPLGQWYAYDVFDLTNEGIVSGKKDQSGQSLGEFSPGQKVKISEVLRMIFEAFQVGPADGETDLAQANDHWAKGYVKRAELLSMSLIKQRADINRDATRAEVCRMLLEAQGIVPADVEKVDFPDVSPRHEDANYIQECKNLGLFAGRGDTGEFLPDEGINRAEAAKVVRLAKMLQ